MDDIQTQFAERIGRAVSRFFHHAEGEGMDPAALNGTVTLTLDDGALTGVAFQPHPPVPKRKAGKRTATDPADALADPDDQPFAHG